MRRDQEIFYLFIPEMSVGQVDQLDQLVQEIVSFILIELS